MQDLENVSASCTILTNTGGCHAHVHWKLFDGIIVQRTAIILVLVESYMNCACNIFVSYRLFNSFYVRVFADFFRDVAINVNVNLFSNFIQSLTSCLLKLRRHKLFP